MWDELMERAEKKKKWSEKGVESYDFNFFLLCRRGCFSHSLDMEGCVGAVRRWRG